MLTNDRFFPSRDVTRQVASDKVVTNVAVADAAANSGHWTEAVSRGRRLRRQRRLQNAGHNRNHGWSVRTW